MNDNNYDKLQERNITEEIKNSFLDYSMSVIVSRALPDVRDGLKPVHRRILYSMNQLGIVPSAKYLKSAKIVGEVMGDYHPHGDSSIYDAMVRMAQKFSYRYVLVDGHGNFGSLDGDGAAAMRYTEAKMSKLSLEMLRDINKDTVDFMDNYDGRLKEPLVLPSRFPNILVNGSTGIAVGMATNIPPHNLGEVIDGTIAYIDNNDITNFELMNYIKGPDFPTGATILGNSAIKKAYETGKSIITIRARAEITESKTGKKEIIISEIPYQLNKATLIQKIADLVKDKVIDGITDLRDESNKGIIKILIELRKDANANVVLNNLYKHSPLQTSYGINLLALVDGQPKILTLKEILSHYVDHQKIIVIRRAKFDLEKAEKRAHILEGLKIALDNIDAIIKLIKTAKSDSEAKQNLLSYFKLTEIQADAILEMKLRRLTGLERDKIESELSQLLVEIEKLKELLNDEVKILALIKEELLTIKNKYSDERRTYIDMNSIDYIDDESLIPVEKMIITLTNKGYIKRLNSDTYHTQNRGGVGIKGMETNEEDNVEQMFYCLTHDHVLFFSNYGKVYRLKGYEIPTFSRQSKGIPIVNILPIEKGEYINSIVALANFEEDNNLIFVTKNGIVKKTSIADFSLIRKTGKIAITLRDNDELIAVKKSSKDNFVMIASSNGKMVNFNENEVRQMGRTASGVKGIELEKDYVIGADVITTQQNILILTASGYGKKTLVSEFRQTHRGSKGVKALNVTEKTKKLIAFKAIEGSEDAVITTNGGIVIRINLENISTLKRVTQGVRLMSLKDNQCVASIVIVDKIEDQAE